MSESTLHMYFITLEAEGTMSLFDWHRHIEELRAAVHAAVPVADWDAVRIYGPGTDECVPMICILAPFTIAEATRLVTGLAETPWFGLPVRVFRASDIIDSLRIQTQKKATA